jgi:hypothetical protein
MNISPLLKRSYLFLLASFCLGYNSHSINQIEANPEFISSGIEFSKTASMRIGDQYFIKNFRFGGIIEVRNEERFNKGIFPNHNWRGFALTEYSIVNQKQFLAIDLGLQHQSAHPTMGIVTHPESEYEYIYDSKFRRFSMNSITLSFSKNHQFGKFSFLWKLKPLYFFYSTNTPEIDASTHSESIGADFGTTINYKINHSSLFASCYLNTQVTSDDMKNGNRWFTSGDSVASERVDSPVIQSAPTFNSRAGWALPVFNNISTMNIYTQFRFGHPRGFADSRESRSDISIGILLYKNNLI